MDGSMLDPDLDDEVSERIRNYRGRYESDAPTGIKPGYLPDIYAPRGMMKSDAILAKIIRDNKKAEVIMIPPPNTIGRTLGRMTIEFIKVHSGFTRKELCAIVCAWMMLAFFAGMLVERALHHG